MALGAFGHGSAVTTLSAGQIETEMVMMDIREMRKTSTPGDMYPETAQKSMLASHPMPRVDKERKGKC